jgi:Arc/MetJ family transcription regulator
MHGRQHIVARRVPPVILGQIVAVQRGVVAHEEIIARPADPVGMLPLAQIPQMMMRIDQADRVGRAAPAGVDGFLLGHYRSPSAGTCERTSDEICVDYKGNIHIGTAMRTNIDIDDELIKEALLLTGLKTKRAVVREGLQTLIRLRRQRKILDLVGKVEWVGNLEESREGRFFDDPC